jgi:hypothetical protein
MRNSNIIAKWRHPNYAVTYGKIIGKYNGDVQGVTSSPVGNKVTHSSTFKIPTTPFMPPVKN